MPYQYASNRNFEDYASGRVLYALPGQPAFPVRLASEILQRALGHWHSVSREGCCRIYDPVCGAGYWLVALGYLHWEFIAAIYASDINTEVLCVAEWNLALLTLAGLERRIDEIDLPKGATIGAIVRGDEVIMGHHDTIIEAEDHVIVFVVNKTMVHKVEKLFQVSIGFF